MSPRGDVQGLTLDIAPSDTSKLCRECDDSSTAASARTARRTLERPMPRPLRSDLPDGVYHVTTRGVADTFVYRDDDDYRAFLAGFGNVVARFEWIVHAFCLMGTHYHAVVETTRERLSRGMHRLNGIYAQGFNERHGRGGHLFGDRFVSRLIGDEEYLRDACRYVVLNPVRAGLVDDAAAWPWSGSRYGLAASAEPRL